MATDLARLRGFGDHRFAGHCHWLRLLGSINAPSSGRDSAEGSSPNEKWVCDLTYLRTWNGFLYLAFVLDCYSRRIVGWQLATHMRTELVLDASRWRTGCAGQMLA